MKKTIFFYLMYLCAFSYAYTAEKITVHLDSGSTVDILYTYNYIKVLKKSEIGKSRIYELAPFEKLIEKKFCYSNNILGLKIEIFNGIYQAKTKELIFINLETSEIKKQLVGEENLPDTPYYWPLL